MNMRVETEIRWRGLDQMQRRCLLTGEHGVPESQKLVNGQWQLDGPVPDSVLEAAREQVKLGIEALEP